MEFGQIVAPTIKELFVERLEGLIFSGALRPGDRIPSERELAEQMKISKTIVHLGLEDLDRMGFIQVVPRRGSFVADFSASGNLETLNAILKYNGGKLDREMMVSIVELRDAVEGGALRRLGSRHTDEDIGELRGIMDEFRAAVQLTGEVPAISAALSRFHYKICTASGNRLFPLLMNAFRGVGSILWEESVRFWGPEELARQGDRIVDMLAHSEGEEAAEYLSGLFRQYLSSI